MKANAGKAAEATVQAWLKLRSDYDATFASHRLPDARAARGALAAQPADAMVVSKGRITFLEVKESAELKRLPRSKVSQWGTLLKMSWAGALVSVIVYRSAYRDWVVFNNQDLFPADAETPTSFPFSTKKTYPSAADALNELFA